MEISRKAKHVVEQMIHQNPQKALAVYHDIHFPDFERALKVQKEPGVLRVLDYDYETPFGKYVANEAEKLRLGVFDSNSVDLIRFLKSNPGQNSELILNGLREDASPKVLPMMKKTTLSSNQAIGNCYRASLNDLFQ